MSLQFRIIFENLRNGTVRYRITTEYEVRLWGTQFDIQLQPIGIVALARCLSPMRLCRE